MPQLAHALRTLRHDPLLAAWRSVLFVAALGLSLLGADAWAASSPSASSAAPATPAQTIAATIRLTLPHGGHVSRATALSIGRATVRLQALQQATPMLEGLTPVRLGFDDPASLPALSSAVLSPDLLLSDAAASPQTLTVRAVLSTPMQTVLPSIQHALKNPEILELRAEELEHTRRLSAEGLSLLELAARQRGLLGNDGDLPHAQRLEYLASQLLALERYDAILTRFGSNWQPPDQAVEALRSALSHDDRNALLWLGLAHALILLDRPHEALTGASTALSLEPDLARAYYVRGLAQLRVHLPALAVSDFSQALTLRQDKAAWWRARGAALLLQNEHERMCDDFYQACALGDCEGLAEVRKSAHCLTPAE